MRSRCALALVVALIVSSFATAFVTNLAPAPPAAAQPGNPGVPHEPVVLFTEDFENVRTPPVPGADPAPPENEGTAEMITEEPGNPLLPYEGLQTSYTAAPTWANLEQCNGIVMSPNTAYPPGACPGGPLPDDLVWIFALQPLARALGGFDPEGRDPAFNHALTAWTDNQDVAPTPAPLLESTDPIALAAPGRFVTFSIDVGVQNCNLADPLLRFFLLDGATAIPVTDDPINPCATQTAGLQLQRLASDSSFLVGTATSELRFRLTDDEFEDQGNDFAYDNIRILDVTPQLDKEFIGDPRFPGAPTVFAGDPATVKFTITNTSELAAKAGWSFTDALPAGLVVADEPNAAIDCPEGSVTATAGSSTIAVTGGRLDAGQVFCEITVDVVSPVPGTFVNVPGDITNAIGLDLPNPATLLVVPPPDLSVVKTAIPAGPVNAGEAIGFDVTVSNAVGAGTAFGVTLQDTLPAGEGIVWDIVDQTGIDNCVILETGVLECGPVDLPAGEEFTVSVQSPTEFASEGDYENSAVAEADNHPEVPGSDSVTVQSPDLTVTKTAAADTVNAGEDIGFSIEIANAGPGTATNVMLTDDLNDLNNDDLPDGLAWAVDSEACEILAGTLTCAFGDLDPGEAVTVNLSAPTSEDVCGTYDDLAVVSADNHPAVPGSDSITVLCPGLNVIKTANPESPVNAGSPIGFDITVINNPETGVATGVTLTDTLPTGPPGSGITWAIVDQTGIDNCAIPDGVELTCGPVDLPAGEEFTVSVQSPTVFDSCAAYENTATADATNAPEPVVQIAVTEVECPALEVEKFANPESPVDAGDPIGFSIVVTNTGPGTATGVTLADTLPTGAGIVWSLTSETDEEANCTLTDGSLSCGPIDLAEGEGFAVQVESPTVFESCGVFENAATATAGNHPDVGATATTEVQCPSLTVTKTPNAASVAIGDPIEFAITVANGGPGDATNVSLTDELPIGAGLEWSITTDPLPADCTITASVLQCTEADLAAGGSFTVTVQSPTVGADCAVLDNTGMATADNHPDVAGSASVEVLCPVLEVVKSAEPTVVPPGGEVTYTYTVTNTGGAPATNVTVEDSPACAPIELIAGDPNGNGALDPGETWTFTCTQIITESIADVVFATGEAGGRVFEDVDAAAVAVLEAGPGPQPPPHTPPPPPTPQQPQPEGRLPITGADLVRWVPLALTLIVLGTALVRRARQRRLESRPNRSLAH